MPIAHFSTSIKGSLRAVAERAKRTPSFAVIAALLGAQAGIRYAEQKNAHPATSETFVAATLHDILELTLR
jgi:hypothetical protein